VPFTNECFFSHLYRKIYIFTYGIQRIIFLSVTRQNKNSQVLNYLIKQQQQQQKQSHRTTGLGREIKNRYGNSVWTELKPIKSTRFHKKP